MEDGIERCRHSLNSYNDVYNKEKTNSKILYLCSPNDEFEIYKCIITDNKSKMQELMKKKYKVSIFIADVQINDIYSYVSQ